MNISANDFLKQELTKRIGINPSYSQRAFARYLRLSPGALSDILNGKRKITYKAAMHIAQTLQLNEEERDFFLSVVQKDLGVESIPDKKIQHRYLSEDLFYVISEWYCLAILNLAECVNFKWSLSYIAKRLGLSMIMAKNALEKLKKVGLINNKGNSYEICQDWVQSPDEIPSAAIRDYHKAMLSKATESLDLQRLEERDVSGIGFAIDPKHLPAIKQDIKNFQETLINKYSRGNKTEVYQLEMALFKLTTGEK